MIKVMQTAFGFGKGNCFTACVASILELPIEDVPDFCLMGDTVWWEELEKWLFVRGLAPLTFCFNHGKQVTAEGTKDFFYVVPRVPLILSGNNHSGVAHSVVLYDGDKIHNPNPNCSGLATYRDIIAFVSLRPELLKCGEDKGAVK